MPHLVVASGLGSSGLTTGPFIGYQLAEYFNTGVFKGELYQNHLVNMLKQPLTLISERLFFPLIKKCEVSW